MEQLRQEHTGQLETLGLQLTEQMQANMLLAERVASWSVAWASSRSRKATTTTTTMQGRGRPPRRTRPQTLCGRNCGSRLNRYDHLGRHHPKWREQIPNFRR